MHSFLYFGVNSVLDRMNEAIVGKENKKIYDNPCYPHGYEEEYDNGKAKVRGVQGTGIDECVALSTPLLHKVKQGKT